MRKNNSVKLRFYAVSFLRRFCGNEKGGYMLIRKETGFIVDLDGNVKDTFCLPPKRNVRPYTKDLLFERDTEKKQKGSAERCSIDLPK